jgi:hypothetical protein
VIVAAIRRAFSFARWLVTLEIGIWRSLFLSVTRRVSGRGTGVEELSYAKEVAPIMGAFIFVSLVELPVVHLLLPWDAVRLIADVLSVWGLLWMLGFLASMKVFPHLLDDHGLRVRHGTTADIRIPWEAVASITSRRGSVPTNRHVQVERTDDGTVVSVAVLKQTKVDVVLRRPITVKLPKGAEEITELRFYVDDPRAFVATAHRHLTDRLAVGQTTSGR